VLTVEAQARDPMTTEGEFQLICSGGFDEHAGDPGKPGSALMLIYPHDDDGDLRSIDWPGRD
jgi:hypothetical protein